ncbi:IclR family transcriptional regulator [Actinopolyspora erythraea]|uniref:IclR family transcriptional regulator n=1 Tax=Actinopolyspora erythraea TaxID=414996 RepID=A0A099D2G4_9ACTN|nr:IclR family transcriptional regulator [Actinopolyspora erythraea]ASU80842.1 IclR family transcriptional regulator [Actinopolyspora erythraea]KGI79977.1 IclR family transcriptional regulator [Actinopolyspora erythraea]
MARAVPALQRAFDILELFLDEPELSAPEITGKLGLPRTTVHELLSTLVERGYLVPSGRGSTRYRLGVRGFQLGSAYADRLDLAREGQLVAEEVAAECNETVHIGIREGTEVLYIAKVDSGHPVRMVSAVGRRLPAHCTAVGKALLASLSRQELDELYGAEPLRPMTDNSITDPTKLREELDGVTENGRAREYCESNDAVACVAAPVRDHYGGVVAAMSIAVPILRWSERSERELAETVVRGARNLSERLGNRA